MSFITELRERRVFRTAAAYLAAAFVLLQAADLTFEPLGFPAGAYRLVVIIAALGFPVAIVLSWYFDLRAQVERAGSRRAITIGVVFFVLLCGTGLGAIAARGWEKADYGTSAIIAVMPFNVIGDPTLEYLESGIVEMVSRNVDGAANLRAIAPEMVINAAKSRTPDAVAADLGARYIVSGNIARAGSEVRITAAIQDFGRKGSKPLTREVTGSAEKLFELIDRLSAQVLAATRSGEDASSSHSAALTTRSLPALRAYFEGEEYFRKTQYDSAVAHFAQAVTIDSTFALAHYRLAYAQIQVGSAEAAREPLQRALRHSRRLTARDQGMVQTLATAFDGKSQESITQLRKLLETYPNDLELTFTLGQMLYLSNTRHGKPMAEAQPLLERVAAADPEFLCPI